MLCLSNRVDPRVPQGAASFVVSPLGPRSGADSHRTSYAMPTPWSSRARECRSSASLATSTLAPPRSTCRGSTPRRSSLRRELTASSDDARQRLPPVLRHPPEQERRQGRSCSGSEDQQFVEPSFNHRGSSHSGAPDARSDTPACGRKEEPCLAVLSRSRERHALSLGFKLHVPIHAVGCLHASIRARRSRTQTQLSVSTCRPAYSVSPC